MDLRGWKEKLGEQRVNEKNELDEAAQEMGQNMVGNVLNMFEGFHSIPIRLHRKNGERSESR